VGEDTRDPSTAVDPRFVERVLRGLLDGGTPVQIEVTGVSMIPFLRAGDQVTLRPPAAGPPRLGDVVALGRPGEKLRVHRVIGRAPGTVLTRGDGAAVPDAPLPATHVVGVVTEVERSGHRVRLGLGPERVALAGLSRLGLLVRLLRVYERVRRCGGPGTAREPTPQVRSSLRERPPDRLLVRAALLEGDAVQEAWAAFRDGQRTGEWPSSIRPLLPLLHWSLERAGLSDPLMAELEAARRVSRYRDLQLFEGAAPALRGLPEAGIPTLLLKGAALATRYYPEPGLRPMADVDVLVRSGDAVAAVDRLTALGWSAPSRPDPWRLAEMHAMALSGQGMPSLDLHWRLQEEAEDSAGETTLWERARPAELAGVATHVLDPADQLLHVVAHGARWRPDGSLRWVADAWVVMRSGELDWDRFVAEARRRRLTPAAGEALTRLRKLLDGPVPGDVVAALRTTPTRRLERWRHRASSTAPEERGPIQAFALHHARYRRLVEAGLVRAGLGGLLTAVSREWGLRGPWSVPYHALLRGARRAAQLLGRRWPRGTRLGGSS
jgi:hypothetical protein